ncbi:MAG: putative surface layer protein, partial [Paenibacillus sp.]|nr:putative surface layer protein [Paenibacillus sp.]
MALGTNRRCVTEKIAKEERTAALITERHAQRRNFMKRSLKKGTAILLTLCMILALIPQASYVYAGGSVEIRDQALDLTADELLYKILVDSNVETRNVSLDSENITDSIEGWKWYPQGDQGKGYVSNTLELGGINILTYDLEGIILPADSTIVLLDGTTNRVDSICEFGGETETATATGIKCKGTLTIEGTGALEVYGGTDAEGPLDISRAIDAEGDLIIKSGTIGAYGESANSESTAICATGVVTIEGGAITAEGGVSSSRSVGIKGRSITFEDGTIIAKASGSGERYAALVHYSDNSDTFVHTGMSVLVHYYNNYVPVSGFVTDSEKGIMYYCNEDMIAADDLLIQKLSATISNKIIAGVTGTELSGTPTMTISLTGTTFVNLTNNTDVSSWFTNLPDGLIATLLSTSGDGLSASIGFSGTPTEASDSVMLINIPAEKLKCYEQIAVDSNSNAKYAITGGEPSGPQKRTNSLDLTVTQLSYKASGSADPVNADPTSEDITDSVEGWKWYLHGDETKGYSARTLELNGINLETTANFGIKLPSGSAIVLADRTTNRVESTFTSSNNSYGIWCLGHLTIQGDSGQLMTVGGNPDYGSIGTSGLMAEGSLLVEGGNITAVGGKAPTTYQSMSTGLRAAQKLKITGGIIYAKSESFSACRAVYSGMWDLDIEEMEAFEKIDGEYTAPAHSENGVLVYASGQYQLAAKDARITPIPLPSFGGNGTEANPYLITSKEELKEMARYVNLYNKKYGNKHYKLMADIVLNEAGNGTLEQWAPIGLNSDKPFCGVFDGGNHSIKGIFINDFTTSYAGLFGYIKDGIVENVGIKDGQVSALGSNSYAGGIAGYNNGGQIEDCFNTTSIVATQSGGITGYNEMGHIQDSYNTGNVAGFVAGGIAGVNQDAELTIVNCYNKGSVKAMKNNDSVYAGGITGKNYSATIKNSYNAGTVFADGIGNGQVNLGGVFGRNLLGDLIDVYWLDSALPSGYISDDTVGIEVKTSSELQAMTEELNENVARLSVEYDNLASWIDDTKNENGGYPLFDRATNYMLTVSGGGTGATADGSYAAGAIISINAGTKEGYTFNGWTKEGGGIFEDASNTVTTFTMPDGDVTITANWKTNDEPGPSNPSRPTPSVKTEDTNVLINGKSQPAGKSETTTGSDGKTLTTVTVDSDKLKSLLSAEKEGAKVTIPIKDGVNAGEGKLTGEMVKSMEDKSATLVIQKGTASYTLPAAEININEVSKKLGTNVSLKDITVSVKISEPTNTMAKVVESSEKGKGFTIVAPAVDFTITCTYGGKSVNSASFNAYVERTIAIPDGVDPSKITTGIVVEPSGTIYHVPTRVTVINGKYYAVINS